MKETFITDSEGLLAMLENLNERVKQLEDERKESFTCPACDGRGIIWN